MNTVSIICTCSVIVIGMSMLAISVLRDIVPSLLIIFNHSLHIADALVTLYRELCLQ